MEINFSYECSDLIKELKIDIKEFGNIEIYAFFKKIEGHTVLFNYDFIEEKHPLSSLELEKNVIVQILQAKKVLNIL